MKDLSPFCTCTDHDCPRHPANHQRGCSLCVAHCLKHGEIPSCFFNAVDSAKEHGIFTYKEFAEAVMRKEKSVYRTDD